MIPHPVLDSTYLLVLDLSGHLLTVPGNAAALLSDDMIGQALGDRLHPDDQPAWYQALADVRLTGESANNTGRWLSPEGHPLWLAWHLRYEAREQRIYVSAQSLREDTSLPVTMHPYEASELRFRTLVDSMDDLVFTLDTEQRHTGVYGKQFTRLGLPSAFFLGKTAAEILGTEAAVIHEQANRRALAGECVPYEWASQTETGTIYYQTTVTPMADASGHIHGVVGIGRDITQLVLAEQEYQTLFDLNPLPQWIYDLNTQEIIHVNEAAMQHYGYRYDEFTALTIQDIRPPSELSALALSQTANRYYQGLGDFGVFTHQKKDGSLSRMHITGHQLEFRGRACELVVAHDVTVQESTMEALRTANQRYELVNQATNDVFYDWDILDDHLEVGGGI